MSRVTRHERTLSGPGWLFVLRGVVHGLLPLVLLTILAVLYLEYIAHVHGIHRELVILKQGILGYFVVHVGIEFLLYDSYEAFLRDNWLDVLLIVPMLSVFRLFGELGEAFRGARILGMGGGIRGGRLLGRLAAVTVVGTLDDEVLAMRETVTETRISRSA
ncbi:MAG: hypothetical protein ABEJ44_05355, partial [Halanaeroarchaeum sp.]